MPNRSPPSRRHALSIVATARCPHTRSWSNWCVNRSLAWSPTSRCLRDWPGRRATRWSRRIWSGRPSHMSSTRGWPTSMPPAGTASSSDWSPQVRPLRRPKKRPDTPTPGRQRSTPTSACGRGLRRWLNHYIPRNVNTFSCRKYVGFRAASWVRRFQRLTVTERSARRSKTKKPVRGGVSSFHVTDFQKVSVDARSGGGGNCTRVPALASGSDRCLSETALSIGRRMPQPRREYDGQQDHRASSCPASQGRKRSIRESRGQSSIEVNISRAIRNSVSTTVPVAESTINYRKYFPGKLILPAGVKCAHMIRRVTWDAGDAHRRPW